MNLLLPCLLLLHLTILLLLYISTISNTWFTHRDGNSSDLWSDCIYAQDNVTWTCMSTKPVSEWLEAVRASMVMAVLFSTLSFLIFACQLFSLRRGSLFYVTAVFQVFAGLCVTTAALIYTLHPEELHLGQLGTYGMAYGLAWAACPLTLASGLMYLHLRKLE